MSKLGKRYIGEFKEEIIRLIVEDKRSVASVVKDFGVNDQTVRNWLKKIKNNQDPDKVRIAELETELRTVRKKLKDSEVTIDILKKATNKYLQRCETIQYLNLCKQGMGR
jgi:transposase-like protein